MMETGLKTPPSSILKPQSNYRWTMVLLACGLLIINYVDRVNIGVAAPTLMKEFDLSPAQMGILMSAFFWAYVVTLFPIGGILNKYGSRIVMFWSCLGWGLVTMCTAFVQGYKSFFLVRVLLGVTEAGVMPGNVRVLQLWLPERERTLSTAMVDGSARIGNAIAPPIVAYIIVAWGWKASFVITGGLAVLYSLVWYFFYRDPDQHPRITESELAYIRQNEVIDDTGKIVSKPIPIIKLFTYPRMLLAGFGFLWYMYFWTTFNMWIPAYLVNAKGFDLKTMGIAAMFPYISGIVFELLGGYIFDQWYRRGATITQLRRTGMAIGMIGGAASLYLAVQSATPVDCVIWLSASMGIFSFGASNVSAVPADLAPYGQAGGVTGVYFGLGNFGSLLGPLLTGYLVSTSLGYDGALLVMCGLTMVGSLCYLLNSYQRLEAK